jgi:hypothetical protein
MSVEKARNIDLGAIGTQPKLHTDGMHIQLFIFFYRHFAPNGALLVLELVFTPPIILYY